jgi:dienelactone hydrolase
VLATGFLLAAGLRAGLAAEDAAGGGDGSVDAGAAVDTAATARAPHPSPTSALPDLEIPDQFDVQQTYNAQPFRVRTELSARKRDFSIYRFTYASPIVTQTPANNTIPADYYLPHGIKPGDPPRPAVICLHILNGNYELVRLLCSSLASRGVPAVMFKLPYYGERSPPGGRKELLRNGRLFVEALPQGIEDARRTLDVLAARPEIDARRIGIAGISLGGIVGGAAAGSDPRFHRAALILAGGELLQVIHHSRESSELSQYLQALPEDQRNQLEQAIVSVDPLTHAPGLRDRATAGRVLMINADQDEVIPPAATRKLAEALGIADRVVWLEGLGHYTTLARLPEVVRWTVDFFAQDLPAGTVPPTPRAVAADPYRRLAELLAEAGSLFVQDPAEGHCHLADVEAQVTDKNGKRHDGRIRWIRGSQGRFRLEVNLPLLGEAMLGQGDFPWMANGQAVFCGTTGDRDVSTNPWEFADPQHLARLRLVASGLSTLKFAPAVLEQVVQVTDAARDDGAPALHVASLKEPGQTLDIEYQGDGRTPHTISLAIDDYRGELKIRNWQLDSVASDELFAPPPGLASKQVGTEDLHHIFSSFFNFAMEQTQ